MSWSEADDVAELRLVYDFLNTLKEDGLTADGRPAPTRDDLADPDALVAWFAYHRLVAPDAHATKSEVRLAHRLRAALRGAIESRTTGRPPAGETLEEVSRELPLTVSVGPDGPQLVPADEGIRGALEAVLAESVEGVNRGSWYRLKMCAADDCRWIFYDASKPKSAKWCDMASCGNRAKTRAYRERKKATAAANA